MLRKLFTVELVTISLKFLIWEIPNMFIEYIKKESVFLAMIMKNEYKTQFNFPLFPVLFVVISISIIFIRLLTTAL